VRPAHHRRQVLFPSRPAAEDVPHRVDRDFELQLLEPLDQEVSRPLVFVAEGEPLHAAARRGSDGGHLLEGVPQAPSVDPEIL
jgi:hypothetical protein